MRQQEKESMDKKDSVEKITIENQIAVIELRIPSHLVRREVQIAIPQCSYHCNSASNRTSNGK